MRDNPFVDERHRVAFEEARFKAGRGGEHAAICGARTRTGAACRQPPLKGTGRCLRHAGPHAARAHRDRQLHDLALGRITFEAFSRAEAKRAVNRLRWEWKKDPWKPGQTINLGPFEERFLVESGIARLGTARVPPAVLDWLRWRYRRLMIDRKRGEDWLRVLREDYLSRVREAGSPPLDADTRVLEPLEPIWMTARVPRGPKRQRPDGPRAMPIGRPQELQEQAAPKDLDENAVALMTAEHRDVLAPLLEMCRSKKEQCTVILALREYTAAPTDGGAGARWRDIVTELWSR